MLTSPPVISNPFCDIAPEISKISSLTNRSIMNFSLLLILKSTSKPSPDIVSLSYFIRSLICPSTSKLAKEVSFFFHPSSGILISRPFRFDVNRNVASLFLGRSKVKNAAELPENHSFPGPIPKFCNIGSDINIFPSIRGAILRPSFPNPEIYFKSTGISPTSIGPFNCKRPSFISNESLAASRS